MKLGVSTLIVYKKKKVDLAEIIESNDEIDRWEILDEGFNKLSSEQVEGLSRIDDRSFSVHAPFSNLNIAEPEPILNEAFLKVLTRSLKAAYKIGAEAWILHPGHYSPFTKYFPELAQNTSLKTIDSLFKIAEDYGIRLYLENLPGKNSLLSDLRSTETFLEKVDDRIGLCLDTGHANLFEGVECFVEKLHDRIGYIHAHDNVGDFDRHLPVGEGTVNWEKVMDLLNRFKFRGWVIVENLNIEDAMKSLRFLNELINP
ncbi:sugar phosphate isomerase/epimerase [Candidatus Bathyarchaeota archaeon]|nr:sugar phosphate isomerase/epimerase [Candidatus Bathyarchaeota archaeon]